jgi:hypothetical protein
MSDEHLKRLALTVKVWAIVVWVLVPFVLQEWHHYDKQHMIYFVQNSILAVLSLLPNRWLVSSRTSFFIFLLLALLPFDVFFSYSVFKGVSVGLVALGLLMSFSLFAPLPLSLIVSRIRVRRGEAFTYA